MAKTKNTEEAQAPQQITLSQTVIIPVRHEFTQSELLEKSNEIAQLVVEVEKLEAEKKTNAAEFKNKIDKAKAETKLLSGHINNGYATVDKACELIANFETKKREYHLKESGEVVKVEDLHAADFNALQKQIDFEAAQGAQIEENNSYYPGDDESGVKALEMGQDAETGDFDLSDVDDEYDI